MIYVKDDEARIYKVGCNTLEEGIEIIHKYEKYVYDLYGGDTWTEDDTWGWWDFRKYKIVDYDSIDNDDEIYDLSDYKFTVQEFCKSYYKDEENKTEEI